MTDKPTPSKNEEERSEETKKLRAETERSLEAARMKVAHGLIEEIERIRKGAPARSLRERIKTHSQMIDVTTKALRESDQEGHRLSSEGKEFLREEMKIYESIRIDFKEVMRLSDEKFEQLFPKINLYFETQKQAAAILINILAQETQMMAYSTRITE